MTDVSLDKRVTELETLVWDMPNLMNLRFGRFDTEFASLRGAIIDNTGRLAAVERAITMVQTDMRDLRGGVTRQLIAQDGQIGEISQQLTEVKSDIAGLKVDVAGMKQSLGEILRRLPAS